MPRRDPINVTPRTKRHRRKRDRHLSHLERPDNLLSWRIDWRQYFRDFCEAHGGNPMEIGGRLVFEDGWSYSATDYKGPEWRPPTNPGELASLLLAYWKAFKAEAEWQLKELRLVRRGLREMTFLRSLKLTRRVRAGKDDAGIAKYESQEITGKELDERIRWLNGSVAVASEQIEKIGKGVLDREVRRPAVVDIGVSD